jgi:HAD superfamily hydrolase (TIGR01509 family)
MAGKPETKAVIFDLDGCLVDSEPFCFDAILVETQQLGISSINTDDIRTQFLGMSMTVICQYLSDLSGRKCPEDFVDRVENRLFKIYQTGLKRIDGALDLIDLLNEASIRTAIATGGSIRRMTQTLAYSGLSDRFKRTAFSAEEVEFGKPAPDLFLYAAQKLGVSPENCLVLEDSPHGITAALAARMGAVGFVGGSHLAKIRDQHAEKLRSAGVEMVLTDLIQLLDHIGVE